MFEEFNMRAFYGSTIAVSLLAASSLPAWWPASALAEDLNLPRQKLELLAPPLVHPHEQVATGGPKIYEVRLVAEEKQMVIDDDGTTLQAMTFNGTIPAPAIVIHEGDYLEVTLASLANNTMPHNVAMSITASMSITRRSQSSRTDVPMPARRSGPGRSSAGHCFHPSMTWQAVTPNSSSPVLRKKAVPFRDRSCPSFTVAQKIGALNEMASFSSNSPSPALITRLASSNVVIVSMASYPISLSRINSVTEYKHVQGQGMMSRTFKRDSIGEVSCPPGSRCGGSTRPRAAAYCGRKKSCNTPQLKRKPPEVARRLLSLPSVRAAAG
jgi:hypothetical protein